MFGFLDWLGCIEIAFVLMLLFLPARRLLVTSMDKKDQKQLFLESYLKTTNGKPMGRKRNKLSESKYIYQKIITQTRYRINKIK